MTPLLLLLLATPEAEQGLRMLDAGRCNEAIVLLEKAIERAPRDPRHHYILGRCRLVAGDASGARTSLARAVELDASSAEHHLWLARAATMEGRRGNPMMWLLLVRTISSSLERAVELAPDDLDARLDLVRYLTRAPRVLGGDVARARREAEEIHKRSRGLGLFASGYIDYREKLADSAERRWLEAIRVAPDLKEPYYWLGYLYQERRRYDEAFALHERLLARDSAEAEACYEIGRTAVYSSRNLDRGIECLAIYIRGRKRYDGPTAAEAHYFLGEALIRQGKTREAKRELERALLLDVDLARAKAAMKRLAETP
ncbi:MAG TPA: tetratricopeptide repeat protein [Thermoanaerobaculia bacterium]|nr:tetratricopeptide repeat protein [Thermoanaerobaculia bacterium]